jgi:hypothetical protein
MVTKVKDSLIGQEKQYWEAIKNNDGKAATQLTAETCLVVGPQGIMEVDKRSLAGMFESPEFELRDYAIDGELTKLMPITDDVAVLAYPVHERLATQGNTKSMDAYDMSVWVRRNDRWVCAAHTETIAEPAQSR